jgi:hypothetical protein
VSLSLGVFDVFTNMVPGSLYVAVLLFLADGSHLIRLQSFKDVPSIVLITGLLIASYLLGWATEPLAHALNRATQRKHQAARDQEARRAFARTMPGASGRPFVDADIYLLLTAAEIHAPEAATEISRLRATGLMLRNCSVPFLAAAAVAIAEAATGQHTAAAAVAAALLAAAALSVLRASRHVRTWATEKTLGVCYWIPAIDDIIHPPAIPPNRRRGTGTATPQRMRHSRGRTGTT